MKKLIKASILAALSLVLVLPTCITPASAKSRVKVISTTSVASQAYHGKKGNIYSSAKLTSRKYKMSHYKYTTWYATKKAVIKNHGKKATLAYIKAGKKSGWIYKKYLTAGKAPYNKQKRLDNTRIAFSKEMMKASSDAQYYSISSGDYGDIADAIYNAFGDNVYFGNHVDSATADKNALLKINALFRGRFNKSQTASFDSMAKQLENTQVSATTMDQIEGEITTLGRALSAQVSRLS